MQDLVYVTHRRNVERKKIEKLKAQLHLLDNVEEKPKNTHILFVDDEKEGQCGRVWVRGEEGKEEDQMKKCRKGKGVKEQRWKGKRMNIGWKRVKGK